MEDLKLRPGMVAVTGHPDYEDLEYVVIDKKEFDPKKGMKVYDPMKAKVRELTTPPEEAEKVAAEKATANGNKK